MVLDSSAILAMTKKETSADRVKLLFEDNNVELYVALFSSDSFNWNSFEDTNVELYVHSANLCEVFHTVWRTEGEQESHAVLKALEDGGIIERNDMDGEFWRDADALIVMRRLAGASLPLGDALGVALARRLDVEFVTSDKHEIQPLHDANLVKALFIR